MTNEQDMKRSVTEVEEPAARGGVDAKREMAGRLLEGDGVDKDEAKAVSLLEDCVAHGDADAMVTLAKCCALGRGMEPNAERAEVLLSDAAEKGNNEARILVELINDWKGKQSISLGLQCVFSLSIKGKLTFVFCFFQDAKRRNARLNVLLSL